MYAWRRKLIVYLAEHPFRYAALCLGVFLEPMAAAKDIRFIVELLEEDQAIQTDGTKLRQMLVNLLSNAIKFTEKGEVRVSCSVANGVLEARIADTGVGIAAENIEDVFEPFWQAEQTATRRTGGTGLGLSVTRKLARLHWGVRWSNAPATRSCLAIRGNP